jgi:pyridoxal phosphate enzyme (YggS family)
MASSTILPTLGNRVLSPQGWPSNSDFWALGGYRRHPAWTTTQPQNHPHLVGDSGRVGDSRCTKAPILSTPLPSTLLSAENELVLAANYRSVLLAVANAAQAAGRDPSQVELVAVTKTVEPLVAKALVRLGATGLGENRLGAFDEKLESFAKDPQVSEARWHFIGQLQRNKARRVVERADVIHSVTSVKLLQAIGRIAGELNRSPGVYLQVKHSGAEADSAKAGLDLGQVLAAAESARDLAAEGKLKLLGLMAMAPLGAELSPEQRRDAAARVFEQNRDLASKLPASLFHEQTVRLSMGMTGDLEQAIAAGATCVRIGSALFRGLPENLRIAPPFQQSKRSTT